MCMRVFIAADHRGFELKNQLIDYLQAKDIRTDDLGNFEYDAQDDYPEFAQKVAKAVLQNPSEHLGIVICGSGIGVSVAANRFPGIVCGVGFDTDQIKHARANDHINVLSIPSDYADEEKARALIDAFLEAIPKTEEKYLRRLKQLDNIDTTARPALDPFGDEESGELTSPESALPSQPETQHIEESDSQSPFTEESPSEE